MKCFLQPGEYSYQFLVDGQWRTSASNVVEPDEQGHLCDKVLHPTTLLLQGSHGLSEASEALQHHARTIMHACQAHSVQNLYVEVVADYVRNKIDASVSANCVTLICHHWVCM